MSVCFTQLLEVVAKSAGQLEGFTGGEPGLGDVAGFAALPRQGEQAGGAAGQGWLRPV